MRRALERVAPVLAGALWLAWMLACAKKTTPAVVTSDATSVQGQEADPMTQLTTALRAYSYGEMDRATFEGECDRISASSSDDTAIKGAARFKSMAAVCDTTPAGGDRFKCMSGSGTQAGSDWGSHAQPRQ